MLVDNHNRTINYLRLAVTDRCNLRCNYCMPSEGINFAKNDKLFTIEELTKLSAIMVAQGITKIRITGGEPFVRKDLMVLLITRRDQYDVVHNNLIRLITEGFNVRINFIALDGQNTQDILPILELTKHYNVAVRYLEEMPFNGGSKSFNTIAWDYKRILAYIKEAYPDYYKLQSPKTSTSMNYKIPGFKGSFGVIPSFSRTFCGSCNRLRISATGDVITCLYAKARCFR